jgi:hypothetical protein
MWSEDLATSTNKYTSVICTKLDCTLVSRILKYGNILKPMAGCLFNLTCEQKVEYMRIVKKTDNLKN